MDFPNPIKSLGVIRNNRHIYNDISKNVLSRQSESFNKQIEEVEQYHMKYGKKMPKIHITDLLVKESLNIPLVNLSKKKRKCIFQPCNKKVK
jgi:S-adenosylhomocysteine hydrolase